MKSLNFEKLRNNWSNLANYCTYAEKYLYSDPQSSVLKLRCFIEELVNYLYKELNLTFDTSWDLFKALKNESFENIIDPNILKKMHAIRIKANKAIHKNYISLDDAKWLLEEAFNISNWFYCTYSNELFHSDPFVLPKPIEDNINHLEETIKELQKIIDSTKNIDNTIDESENSKKIELFKNKNIKTSKELGLNSLEVDKRITINEIFSDYELNEGQKNLVNNLDDFLEKKDFNVFLLKGYAGTGKTFITKGLTEYLTTIGRKFILAAPTGKAAKVIKEKTENEAFTIHKTIYSYKDLKEYKVENIDGTETFKFYFDLNNNTHDGNTVYIIDEASMIANIEQEGEFFRFGSGKLLTDLMKYIHIDHNDHNKKIIFIGDNAQLPPIGMNSSPALNSEYLEKEFNLKCKSFELTEIMRQSSSSGIMENSLTIRECIRRNTFNQLDINLGFEDVYHVEHEDLLDKYINSCDNKINGESIIIAHSNTVVDEYNSQIRKHFFPNKSFITIGDKVMAVANNANQPIFIYNGDFGLIKKVDENIIKREVFVREKINEKLTITTTVPLWFRKVEIGFKNVENNKSYFFECLIFENILYRELVYQDTYFQNEINKYGWKSQDINRLETFALYVDFVNRAKEKGLKPNTEAFKQEIKKDIYFNALKIKFGYALTCHKAQGSEWNNVFVNCNTHENILTKGYFRWLYTAMTRASKKLYLMDEPHFTPFTKMQQHNIPVQQPIETKIVDESINNEFSVQTALSKSIEDAIYLETKILLDQSDIKIIDTTHNQYCEQYTLEYNNEICRIKINYNARNKITKISAIETNSLAKLAEFSLKPLENKTLFLTNITEDKNQFVFAENFLEEYYNAILNVISNHDIEIIQIEHFNYLERYTFKQNNEVSIIDFNYNGRKQFTRSQPQNNSSIELSKLILSLLN